MEWNERKAKVPFNYLFAILMFALVLAMVITVLVQS